MAVHVGKFTSWKPAPFVLWNGVEYPCRQQTAGGKELLAQLKAANDGEAEEPDISVLIDEVEFLLGAPHDVVRRCSIEELLTVLVMSGVAADKMQRAIAEDAEKNGQSGAAKPTPRSKAKK
jgi:hypothetical protein